MAVPNFTVTCLGSLVDAESDAHSGRSDREGSKWAPRLRYRVLSCLPFAVRLLVEELRNLPSRISARREIEEGFLSGSPILPKGWERFAVSGPSSHRRAYTHMQQELKSEFPFLSTLDVCLATLAWKAGTQTEYRSSCTESDRSS
jgi:hypothetical protein